MHDTYDNTPFYIQDTLFSLNLNKNLRILNKKPKQLLHYYLSKSACETEHVHALDMSSSGARLPCIHPSAPR